MGDKRQYERLNMMYLADLMRLELSHPFDLHPFDSIVAATLPDVTFSTRLTTTAADSLYQWEATLHSGGSLLRPLAQVVYPYNPLKRQKSMSEFPATCCCFAWAASWRAAC